MFPRLLVLTIVGLAAPVVVLADPPADLASNSWESAAKKLQLATVTIRIWCQTATPPPPTPNSPLPSPSAVTVCSGLCIRDGQIITAAFAGSDSPIRLTFPGGKQADAKLQAIDEYSGLALIKADTTSLTPLAAAGDLPAVGSELLTAAAWGLEQPLVSRGIVGGVDRQHPGANYPPLLQCDCITMSTSTGAGLVDRQGKLTGVIVAADREPDRRGWAYAVPASHVERLLRAAVQHATERKAADQTNQQTDSVLILKRRRPVVGMVLDQQGDAVVVARLAPGGPAEKAGIKPGDQVVSVGGVAIRSVYQAVLPTIYKQPGDTSLFRVHREGMLHDLTVTLGGGVELSSAPTDLLAGLVQPKIHLAKGPSGAIVTTRGPTLSPAVAVLPPLPSDNPPITAPTPADKIALLEKSLARYQAVIELQQQQLTTEEQHRREQDTLLQSLRAEIDSLRAKISK